MHIYAYSERAHNERLPANVVNPNSSATAAGAVGFGRAWTIEGGDDTSNHLYEGLGLGEGTLDTADEVVVTWDAHGGNFVCGTRENLVRGEAAVVNELADASTYASHFSDHYMGWNTGPSCQVGARLCDS